MQSVEKTVGRSIIEGLAPEIREQSAERSRRRSLGLSVPNDFEAIGLRKDGSQFPIHVAVGQVQLPDGAANIAFVTDISERKRSEQALKESEERFRRMFQFSASGMVLVSTDFRFLQVNDAFCKLLGYSEKELLERTFQDVTPEEDRPIGSDLSARTMSGEIDHFHVEKRYQRKNGEIIWAIVSSTLLRDAQGKPLHFVTLIEDITDRKRAEEALRESEEKFRSIIEQSTDGIIVTDEDGKIVEWNRSQETLSGLMRSEVLEKPLWEVQYRLVPPDMQTTELRERIETELKEFLKGNKERAVEKRERRMTTLSGSARIVSESAFLVRKGNRNLGVSVHNDITEKKNVEDERSKLERYLQQAQRLESLGVLAGGIAHDFNNILQGIFGFTDLARSEAKDSNVAGYLSEAMASMQRAKGLTQQLLTFSKGGAPVRKVVEVAPLIRETCQFALHGSRLRDSYDLQENLWDCNIDRNQIGQVLQNIVINAIQAMPMGGTVEVSARNVVLKEQEHPTLKEGAYVVIDIRDQGIGISKEMLSMIFDPFFTTKTEGHGLGLAISHSIIVRHGGAINVASELGKGATFTIYLPACQEREPQNGEKAPTRHFGDGVILVMDDDKTILILISKMLESLGYTVICKESGRDTLECYKAQVEKGTVITALVLDLTIPGGIGGKEVAEEIRKLDKSVPIFVSSGYADDPVIANPHEYGFTASLSKPFRNVELMEMFDKHLKKNRAVHS
jgi:PAS domain S-box-containing protein